MKYLKIILLTSLITLCGSAYSQKSFNDYIKLYPIGEDPYMRYLSSYRKEEKIVFDACPTLRLSFFNNMLKGLTNNSKYMQSWYAAVKPHWRIYTDNSLPVKTPSFWGGFGTQHLFRLDPFTRLEKRNGSERKRNGQHFVGFLVESAHYSNGQSGSSFSDKYADGSPQGDSIYTTITDNTDLSAMLNRTSGNFSTNLTQLLFSYKRYLLDDDYNPEQGFSLNLGTTLYHDKFMGLGSFGGYTDQDIVLYGKIRYHLIFDIMKVINDEQRVCLKQNFEYIQNPHKSVNPLRSETTILYYPFKRAKEFGFFTSLIYGHDNYNFRFVDSGTQFSVGITWSQFPPITLRN